MLFFTFINGAMKMKKFIIITSIILTILFILLYIIIFYDYKTSEKTKKFMVSQYNAKNKTINTFCSDYYEFAKAYNRGKDKYYESMNLRRTGEIYGLENIINQSMR